MSHEFLDDSVEFASLEPEPLLSGAQGSEVVDGPGDNVITELHFDPSFVFVADGDIEVNFDNHVERLGAK